MLETARGGPVEAELVWLGAGAPRREPVPLDRLATERELRRDFDALIAEAERAAARKAAWRRAADEIRFPFPEPRPGQREMARHVERALAERELLLLEAATGSGKTAALLTPALRFALATGRRLVVLTASTLQQHAIVATLRRLAPAGLPLAVRLRARARMCANGELLCHASLCRFARGGASLTDRPSLLASCFDADGLALPDRVFERGRGAPACPAELQLDAAQEAPVTVCDLNYAIDPAVTGPELRDPARLRDTIFLLDEVHRVPDRAREALSVRLGGRALRGVIDAAALGSSALHRELRNVAEDLSELLRVTAAESGARPGGDAVPFEPPAAELAALAERSGALALEAATRLGGTPAGPLAALFELARELDRFVTTTAERRPGFVALVDHAGGEPFLEHHCVDPSEALAPLFARCHAAIGCSATLSPPELFLAELGFPRDRSAHVRIPAEDRSARRAVVIDTGVGTREAEREREAPRLARRIAALAAAVPGNVLVLFPSLAFLERVRGALPECGRSVLWQTARDGEDERVRVVDSLREAHDVLVLAVAGGSLAEGVDYAGAGLAAVAVVGPCVPSPSVRRALLAEHLGERFDRGFELAYAVPGMTRVVQSAGRLLRTGSDRGVIALYDRRFLREPYRGLLPPEWLAGGSAEGLRGEPARVARRFFAR